MSRGAPPPPPGSPGSTPDDGSPGAGREDGGSGFPGGDGSDHPQRQGDPHLPKLHRDVHPGAGRSTEVVVDLDACARNLDRLRAHVGPRGIWAVVKADAYGHGAVPVASALAAAGATGFCVATAAEGAELRRAGIAQPILVMAGIEPAASSEADSGRDAADGPDAAIGGDAASAQEEASPSEEASPAEIVVDHGLRPAVWNLESVRELAAAAAGRDAGPVPVHLKVDTGMGRLGVLPDRVVEVALRIRDVDGVRIDGVFTNLSSADEAGEAGRDHTRDQVRRFEEICRRLADAGCHPARRHVANSAGLLHHPESWDADWCTDVRPGLALYGVSQTPDRDPDEMRAMEPVLELRTRVAAVRRLPAGWPVGYGRTSVTATERRVAVLPVGYHDGWPRALGNRGEAILAGRRVRILGAVSMDLTVVDVDELEGVAVGDPAVLIGAWPGDGAVRITAEEVAERAGTIAHELLCRIGCRVPRRYVGEGA